MSLPDACPHCRSVYLQPVSPSLVELEAYRCEACGREYRDHPHIEHGSAANQLYLRVLCDGTVVKL